MYHTVKNRVHRFFYLFLALSVMFLCACEKVIELNLKGAEKKYVIEAQVTGEAGEAQVLISKTKDFDDNNDFAGISGAVVTIEEEGAAVVTLSESAPGVYQHATMQAASGKLYKLKVVVDGKQFTASCRMPERIQLDSVYNTSEFVFSSLQQVVNADFQDPPGRGNYYRFVQYINNVRIKQFTVQSDDYTDGRYVNNKLFYFADENSNEPEEIKLGDSVIVEMQNIDPAIYKYWYSLSRSALGGSGQATPANPVTNISGGALGYFSVHQVQTKAFKVK